MNDPYEVLGLRSGSSPKEIHKAYRRLAKLWHPDRFPDAERRKEAEVRIRALNEAYRALSSGETPPPVDLDRPASPSAALQPRIWPGMVTLVLGASVLLAALYGFLWLRDHAGKITLNGISFREWEWDRAFRIGSTKDEVLAIQGTPNYTSGDRWVYGVEDVVIFTGGRVSAVSNVSGNLKVNKKPAMSQESLTIT